MDPMNSALSRLALVMLLTVVPGCAPPADEPPAREAVEARTVGDPGWLETLVTADPLMRPQATSLFGEELYAQLDTAGIVAEADAALLAAPDDVELLIAAGRVRRNVWQYRQAMQLYDRAAGLAPEDWRPVRFRGHRHLSVREFDRGIADLERARELAPLNWDVAYHLGLAYFLAGRFDDAADEYLRCLELADDPAALEAGEDGAFRSCSANATDPESLVAMMEWAVRALQRAGRGEEADRLVASLPAALPVEENIAYYHNLLLHRGEMTEEQMLELGPDSPYRLETVGFGIANRRLAQGDTTGAVELLRQLAADPWWPGFGRIAAEAELVRLGVAPSP
jgi:tetratricopeptide (TPR) repeat protein